LPPFALKAIDIYDARPFSIDRPGQFAGPTSLTDPVHQHQRIFDVKVRYFEDECHLRVLCESAGHHTVETSSGNLKSVRRGNNFEDVGRPRWNDDKGCRRKSNGSTVAGSSSVERNDRIGRQIERTR